MGKVEVWDDKPIGSAVEHVKSKKPPYPLQIFFIIGNELCERFMIYGMRGILVLYMSQKLLMDKDTATLVYHANQMMIYFACIFGAILSDTWLGRYKTILVLSIVYAIGGAVIALSATPYNPLSADIALYAGLALVSIGAGGIKPCVAAFGGDQFKLPEQAAQVATFFSIFYFTISAGSLLSTTITPILREDVHCFGEADCYALAFGVPAILMVIAVGIFVMGKPLYTMTSPSGNVLVKVANCIMTAISTRKREKRLKRREHFLDYAIEKHGPELVRDTKILLRILVLYLPLPFFWTLFDQQGSRWTFQAARMDGDIGIYTIKPDQMHLLNPLLVLIFIPICKALIVPAISRIGIRTPLRRMALGGLLTALAFFLSALVELQLDRTSPIVPTAGQAQVRVFNGLPCDYHVYRNISGSEAFTLKALHAHQDLEYPLSGRERIDLQFERIGNATAHYCPHKFRQYIEVHPNVASSLFVCDKDQLPLYSFVDNVSQSRAGNAIIRVLVATQHKRPLIVRNQKRPDEILVNTNTASGRQFEIQSGSYEIVIGDVPVASIALKQGSVSTILISDLDNGSFAFNSVEIVPANSMSMLWMSPQFLVLSIGETIYAVTGIEFSYAQAPQSMKSVLQACWLLTIAVGNALLMIIVKIKLCESQANEFFLFAALMVLDMCVFMVLAYKYKGYEPDKDLAEQTPLKSAE